MSLEPGLKTIRILQNILSQLVNKEVAIACYLGNETMWSNSMKRTVPTMPEANYRRPEETYLEVINSVCLIAGNDITADAMTKSKDNGV